MDREISNIVGVLTACVAMRYAAEKNLNHIEDTEVCVLCLRVNLNNKCVRLELLTLLSRTNIIVYRM